MKSKILGHSCKKTQLYITKKLLNFEFEQLFEIKSS